MAIHSIIIEKLRNINTTQIKALKLTLRKREIFRINKLKTLTPYGSNQQMN